MGSRNYNIYVRSSKLDAVERGLTAVFEQEGYHRIPKPPSHILEYYHCHYDYMQMHKDPRLDSLRAAALFPGAVGWTMMQTHPSDILCRHATGDERPRLVALAVELGCDAFQLNLYDSDTLILLETNADGQMVFSGYGSSTPKEIEALILDEHRKERFSLLQVPEIQALLGDEEAYIVDQVEAIAAMLCGSSFDYWEDNTGDLVFNPNGEIEAPGARALYFQRDSGPQIK